MAEKAKSLVETMKETINRSGNKKQNSFYVKKDGRVRVRFLNDMEEGSLFQFHDKWGEFNHVCLEYYGKECPNCKNKEARTSDNFVWTVWNYETKRRELFIFKANKCSPIPCLVSLYETYGNITDRDYVIQKHGEGTDTNYSVVPMDKKRFKGDEEPFTRKQILKMLKEMFPYEDDDNDEDDEDEEEVTKTTKTKKSAKTKKVVEDEDDFDDDDEEDDDEDEDDDDEEDDDDFDDEDEDDEPDYESMTGKELKAECKKRKINYKGLSRKQVIKELKMPF